MHGDNSPFQPVQSPEESPRTVDPLKASYPRHASVDDNIVEWIRTTLRDILGGESRRIDVSAKNGTVILEGDVRNVALRKSVLDLATRTMGVIDVVDRLRVLDDLRPGSLRALQAVSLGRTYVYVTRYCGLDDASTTAAIRQGIVVLDAFLSAHGAPRASELILAYRNLVPGAITLEIGVNAPPAIASKAPGEIMGGVLPTGVAMVTPTAPGLYKVLQAIADNALLTRENQVACWQTFKEEQFRPWKVHAAATIMASVQQLD